jgi:glycosyltransferase involved in cell wall biosynthesis
MRIAIACMSSNQPEGGVANVVHNTAQALRSRGHEVTCLFSEDVLPSPPPISRFHAVYFSYRLAKILSRRRNEFDVAVIHAPGGFIYGSLRSFWRGADGLPPYVMFLHGIEERRVYTMEREAKKGRAWYFRWKNRVWQRIYHMPLYRWCIQTADHAVVINWETWTMLQLKYGREIGSVWYVPNGVENRFFIQREFSSGDAPRLLFVGGWLDHKGVYYLRDGFEDLAKRVPEARLTIAGCSASAETVRDFFPAAVRDRLDILPFVPREDMPSLYARHDLFVFPSLFEGMPIVLLEAMATGMSVVTTETCGMKDIVEDEYNGLLVKPADTPAFVAATERMIHCGELRARLGREAQQSMRRYGWDQVAARLDEVLQLAAQRDGKGTAGRPHFSTTTSE